MPAEPSRGLLRGLAGFRVVQRGTGRRGRPAPAHGGEELLGVVEGVEGAGGGGDGEEGGGRGRSASGRAAGPSTPAQLQLRVRLPGGEALLLPAVPEIVPAWCPSERLLLGAPPPGLLELARADFKRNLSGEGPDSAGAGAGGVSLAEVLEPHVRRNTLPDGSSYGVMPTRRELELRDPAAARAVRRAGGYQATAAALGLHPPKRPPGWWDLDTLEAEIEAFMQALWTEIRDPDTGEVYCYHQVTGQQVDGRPEDCSTPRVMPTGAAVRAAGRWDLHYGVLENGGYG